MFFSGEYFSDSILMFSLLDELELSTGNERSGSKFFGNKNIIKKPESSKVGYTWRVRMGIGEREYCPIKKLYKTKLNSQYPQLLDIFREYRDYYFPDFEFDEVQINRMEKGSRIKQHLDSVNVGKSYLVAFGDYTGGQTIIQNEKDNNFIIVDCRDKPQCFNGAKRKHSVTTVTSGKRYSNTPNENQSIKINDLECRGNIAVLDGTINANSIIASGLIGTVSCKTIKINGGSTLTQLTSPSTAVDASTAGDVFKITTVSLSMASGGFDSFIVNLSELNDYDNIIVSIAYYTGTFVTNGIPQVSTQWMIAGANSFRIGILNSGSSSLAGSLDINVSIIRGGV